MNHLAPATKPQVARSIAAATAVLAEYYIDNALCLGGMKVGEHADGSGRWHVIADGCTPERDDREHRVFIDPTTGFVSPVEDITGVYA